MSLKAFRKIQVSNVEGTPGSAEVATEILYGTIGIPGEGYTIHWPEEDRYSLARHMADDEIVQHLQELVWTGDLNHRHAAWLLCMAIRGNITPTQPDVTNEPNTYLWTIAPALTTPNTPDQANGVDTFTIEYGDDTQAYETEYCFATSIEIAGSPGGVCTFTANIQGRQQADTSFTGALTAETVQRFPFNLVKFYIDTTWAGLGGTQKTGLLRSFRWKLDTQLRGFFTADGNLYFGSVVENRKSPELTVTYKRGSDSDAEQTKYEARTTTFLRLELWGQTEMDSSQSNPPYLIIDGAYRYADWPDMGDDEGASTIAVPANGVYDSTGAKMFQCALLTDLDAYP